MKTERRHELQHNALADVLGTALENVKPYTQLILGVVLAVIVMIAVWQYVQNRSTADVTHAWESYLQASAVGNADEMATELAKVSEQYPDTPAATWANLTLGDHYLSAGSLRLYSNRSDSRDDLRKAEDYYRAALEEADEPLLAQRATLGLARVYESLIELDKAREQYEALAKKWPDGPFASTAKARLEDLAETSTKQFYDWLAQTERTSTLDGPGTPGQRPNFDDLRFDDHPTLDLNPSKPHSGSDSSASPSAPTETPAASPESSGTPAKPDQNKPDATPGEAKPPASTPDEDAKSQQPETPRTTPSNPPAELPDK
jgi:predicted negative regulator of RcsB-dependent stress response